MPAKSEKQRKFMAAALAYKRGENSNASARVKQLAASMTQEELEDYARKPREASASTSSKED
jgi:hypothetical protein